MAQDWDIKSRRDACQQCETAFEDKQAYFSVLVFGEEGYERKDCCRSCWDAKQSETTPYSSWQGVFRVPPAAPEEALKKETAETLLRKLMEEEDEASRNVMYILAVMLERKRVLVERDVQTHDDGRLIRVYEHRGTNEVFMVPDPKLQLDKLEEVQEQVMTMLGVHSDQESGDGDQETGQESGVGGQESGQGPGDGSQESDQESEAGDQEPDGVTNDEQRSDEGESS